MRAEDGSAGDVDYGTIGAGYRQYRQPEPEIATAIARALGQAHTVLNVGAGAGSYEPTDREVTAVEPSAAMRAQRPGGLVHAIDAVAESLPFDDNTTFDASMTTFSVHQWRDLERGLAELRRVTRGPIVILTCDPTRLSRFWLTDYAPQVTQAEASRYPSIDRLRDRLGGNVEHRILPIPFGCLDGFNEAYYGRPELLLDSGARLANSAWSLVGDQVEARFESDLRHDLDSGEWDRKHGHLRHTPHFTGSLTLLTALP